MRILGIDLQKPSFGQMTAAAVMACGLWLAYVAVWMRLFGTLDRIDAGATLIVLFWGCACVHFGIRIERGLRHLLLNLMSCAVLLGTYQGAISVLA
jgi:hypothetical protein